MAPTQWDKYADLYNQAIGHSGDSLHRLIDPFIFKWLGRLQSQVILDAGCGNGYLSHQLAKSAKKVVGIDNSKKLLSIAQSRSRRKNLTFKLADLGSHLPFNNEEFHTIIAHMVLQYLPTLKTVSREFARLLKPRGRLIISVDHPSHALFYRAQELAGLSNPKFLTPTSYFKEERQTKKSLWDKAVLTYYHRPLTDYFEPFKNSGLILTQLKELREDKLSEIPRILLLVFTKTHKQP